MSYRGFAEFYDRLTSNVNYAAYARRLDRLVKRFRPESKSIVELACGTMSLGLKLYELGYLVLGTDLSESMLSCAEEKIARNGFDIDICRQDMRALRLPRPADVFVCSLDGLNHLDGIADIKKTFNAVRKNLEPGGLFIFDMNTPYKHREVLGYNTFVYELPGVCCVWQNEFDGDDCSVGIKLDIFSDEGGVYRRITEEFREKAYPKKVILSTLRECGFETLATYDELKSCRPTSRTERILYVAGRK